MPQVKAHAADMMRRQFVLGEPAQAAAPDTDAAALGTLSMPAMVAVGECDMPDFFDGGKDLARHLGADDLVVIAAAGHLAPLEQPEAVSKRLIDFVRRTPVLLPKLAG